jgi:hypothetical protein
VRTGFVGKASALNVGDATSIAMHANGISFLSGMKLLLAKFLLQL